MTYTTKHLSLSLGLALGVALAACVGGDPDEDPQQTPQGSSALELLIEPAELTHGTTSQIRVVVVKRSLKSPVTLQLGGGVSGLTFSAPVVLLPTADEITLTVTVGPDAPPGPTTLQLTASADDLAEPLVLAIDAQIRGESGTLDRSFGINGTTEAPLLQNAAIRDAVLTAEGELLIAGPTELIRYNAGGKLDSSFGAGGVLALQGDCIFSPSSLEVGDRTWNLIGLCEKTATKLTVSATPPHTLDFEYAGSQVSSNRPVIAVAAVSDGFVWANADQENSFNLSNYYASRVQRILSDGSKYPAWDPNGQSVLRTPDTRARVVDLRADNTVVHALVQSRDDNDNGRWSLLQLNPGSGEIVHHEPFPMAGAFGDDAPQHRFSPPKADGTLYLSYPSNRACVLQAQGTAITWRPAGCTSQPPAVGSSQVIQLKDGRFLVVTIGDDARWWTMSPQREPESPLDGVSFPADPNSLHIVRVLEGPQRRVVVVSRTKSSWHAQRFWL